jgi:Na+/proline symporter
MNIFSQIRSLTSLRLQLSAALVLLYTIAGGLFSVAYTDVLQAGVGWIGCVSFVFYMIRNFQSAAPPSIGFPLYSYPDQDTCDLYSGVACSEDPSACCYNEALHCPNGVDSADCVLDNGAYPFGDLPRFSNQMFDALALAPFPNAIVWDWATIFVLGFGNIAALDFQARCMASRTPKIATIGCLLAGCLTFAVGIPFAYLGAITRVYYGPDSARAEFVTDVSHEKSVFYPFEKLLFIKSSHIYKILICIDMLRRPWSSHLCRLGS